MISQVKQKAIVLDALACGCQRTHEVVALTGLPRKHCAALLSILVADGAVYVSGRKRICSGSGRPANEWRLRE